MIRYRLSTSQQKELLIRGSQLSIAIPWDFDRVLAPTVDDVRDVLEVDPAHIVDADTDEILVAVSTAGRRANTLGDLLGTIVDESTPDSLVCTHAVVVATLCAVPQPRHHVRTQWPMCAIVNGTRIPGDRT